MNPDIPREQLMSAGLPTAVAYVRAFSKAYGWRPRLCIFGPTEEEMEMFARDLLSLLADHVSPEWPNLHLPVISDTNFHQLIEQQWRWSDSGYRSGITIVAIPSSQQVFDTLPRGQTIAPRNYLLSAHPALVIGTLLDYGRAHEGNLILLPDSCLSATNARAHLRFISQRYFELESSPSVQIRSKFTDNTSKQSPNQVATSSAVSDKTKKKYSSDWQCPFVGFIPTFIWSLDSSASQHSEIGEKPLVTAVGYKAILYPLNDPHSAVHLRRLTPDIIKTFSHTKETMEDLLLIASGKHPRGEDDCFVPIAELLVSGHWSAANPDRELNGFRCLIQRLGYPLRRVSELCEFLTDGMSAAADTEQDNDKVWMDLSGRTSGRVYSKPPQDLNDVACMRCEDAEFLKSMLSDTLVQDELRCRSYGSFLHPKITAAVIKNLYVPWPNATERDELRKRADECLTMIAEIEEKARYLADGAEYVINEIVDESKASLLFEPSVLWSILEAQSTPLCETIARSPLARLRLQSEMPDVPPAPLAILQVRMKNAATPLERLELAFNYAEFLVRYDAAVACAMLSVIDPTAVRNVFKNFVKKGKLQLTFGQWIDVRRVALVQLRACLRGKDSTTAQILGTLQNLVSKDSGEFNEALKHLVTKRNEKAHGSVRRPHECEKLLTEIECDVDVLNNLRTYIRQHRLIYLERTRLLQGKTELQVRLLMHAGAEFARESIVSHRDELRSELVDEEVYLISDDPDSFLCLSPWIRFGTGNGSTEVVWFLDAVEGNCLRFISPQAADRWTVTEDTEEIRRLLGLG